jgi:hypothetical protein
LFLAFPFPLILSASSKYLSFAPVWGVILVSVLFLKEIFYQAQNEIAKRYILLESEKITKMTFFSFQAMSVRTDKF